LLTNYFRLLKIFFLPKRRDDEKKTEIAFQHFPSYRLAGNCFINKKSRLFSENGFDTYKQTQGYKAAAPL
jgi:hypothetical protein